MEKKNTKFWDVVFVSIYVAVVCTNLCMRLNTCIVLNCLLSKNQLSTLRFMNLCVQWTLFWKNQMKWLEGNGLIEVMDGFKDFYSMPPIHGTIDAT